MEYSLFLPEDIAEEARSRAGKGAFSAYVTAARRRQLERDRPAELVDASEQRLGPTLGPSRFTRPWGSTSKRAIVTSTACPCEIALC
jgi:hypothetical protein